jgi:crossover junction endodeoxyribonuclease RusA
MTIQTVTLPWPQKELNPNARVHRMVLAKEKRAYKAACILMARKDGVKAMPNARALHLTIVFVPPDKRRRDLDNMLASIKSGLDGLSHVLGVDDDCWSLTISKTKTVGGYVTVTIKEAQP